MPRFDFIYTNFSSGEFSPLLAGRIDLQKYRGGCEILENFYPRPHGPAIFRGGMKFIGEVKDSTKKTRLIPFDAGTGSGLFHLEFGENYIRFYTEDARLDNPPGTPYELTTTYLEDELFEIYPFQDANTLYLFHPNHKPATLVRNDTYNWVLSDIVFTGQPSEWTTPDPNYPGCGAFYEERLYYGGCLGDPSTIWGSKVGEYFNLTVPGTITDADAFKYIFNSDKINLTRWFSPGEILAVGTSGGEYKLMSTSFNEAITPTNVKVVRQTNYGVAAVLPIRIGNRVIYTQKGRLKVRNFAYRLDSDSYTSEDLTLLSEHITDPAIGQSEYSNEPDSIAYWVRDDGQLVGLSYEPEIDIISWFRIVTQGEMESISVTDGWEDERYDDIMVIVNRNINGSDVRYIEKLIRPLGRDQDVEDSFYVDSGLTYEGVATDTISGFDHLEGETLRVLVDGATHPDVVVSSGTITLQREGEKVHAGLGYDGTLKTMRVEGGNPIGTAQGKIKRISKSQVRLYRSVGIVVNNERYHFMPPVMNQPVELQSGDIEIALDDGYELAGQMEIVQNQPLPLTIVAIMPEVRTL